MEEGSSRVCRSHFLVSCHKKTVAGNGLEKASGIPRVPPLLCKALQQLPRQSPRRFVLHCGVRIEVDWVARCRCLLKKIWLHLLVAAIGCDGRTCSSSLPLPMPCVVNEIQKLQATTVAARARTCNLQQQRSHSISGLWGSQLRCLTLLVKAAVHLINKSVASICRPAASYLEDRRDIGCDDGTAESSSATVG